MTQDAASRAAKAKAKQCPALSFPELHRCELEKGHEGPHMAIKADMEAALRKHARKVKP